MGVADREKSKFRRYWQVKWFSNLFSNMVLGEAVPLVFYSYLPSICVTKAQKQVGHNYNTADVGLYMDEKSLETGIVDNPRNLTQNV